MSEQKILTPKEALIALAEGKKLRRLAWAGEDFIHLSSG